MDYFTCMDRKVFEPSIRFFGRSNAGRVLIHKSVSLNIDSVSYINVLGPLFNSSFLSKSGLIKGQLNPISLHESVPARAFRDDQNTL